MHYSSQSGLETYTGGLAVSVLQALPVFPGRRVLFVLLLLQFFQSCLSFFLLFPLALFLAFKFLLFSFL